MRAATGVKDLRQINLDRLDPPKDNERGASMRVILDRLNATPFRLGKLERKYCSELPHAQRLTAGEYTIQEILTWTVGIYLLMCYFDVAEREGQTDVRGHCVTFDAYRGVIWLAAG